MVYVRGFTERGIDYDPKSGLFVLARTDLGGEAFLSANLERVEGGWKTRASSATGMVASFAKSVTSGRATDEVVARRRLSCFGDEVTPACQALDSSPEGAFCAECSCPRWGPARLDKGKLQWAYLECPRQRPGFSNEAAP